MNLSLPPVCPRCGEELAPQKINLCSQIVEIARQRPDLTYTEIGERFRISSRTVKRYVRRAGLTRRKAAR